MVLKIEVNISLSEHNYILEDEERINKRYMDTVFLNLFYCR